MIFDTQMTLYYILKYIRIPFDCHFFIVILFQNPILHKAMRKYSLKPFVDCIDGITSLVVKCQHSYLTSVGEQHGLSQDMLESLISSCCALARQPRALAFSMQTVKTYETGTLTGNKLCVSYHLC